MRWKTGKDFLHQKRPQAGPVKYRPAPNPAAEQSDQESDFEEESEVVNK